MIAIAPEAQVRRGSLPRRELNKFVREASAAAGLNGELSILLTSDVGIQELNHRFRGKKKPTDVLSFPGAYEGHAGDVAVSLDTAARQALQLGHSVLTEVKVLLLHGILHLAGFDHERDAGQMAEQEHALRTRFGLPASLIERTQQLRTHAARVREGTR